MVEIIAGLYPSLYLSSFNPIGIFRGGSITGSKSNFIRLLVTCPVHNSYLFLISTSIFIKQLNFIQNKDLGIDGHNVIVIPTGLWYGNKEFKEELLRNPKIIAVSASTNAPIEGGFKRGLSLSHLGRSDTIQVNHFFVDEDFAKTYKLTMVKGRFLEMTSAGYWDELGKTQKNKKDEGDYAITIPIVINETAEKMLGFDEAVGQRIGDDMIVGVVKDFNFRSLHYTIEPLIMSNNPEAISTMNVLIASGNTSETLNYISDVYKKHRDDREFSYRFFDDIKMEKYQSETRLRNITLSFALLAIMISILGILGMTIFSIERRTKEIGIRRVAGATNSEILILLNREFIIWVVVAFIVASPLAFYTMNNWLQNFVYKTQLSWWIFALSGIIAFGIALITVNLQSWRAANRNPVEALRYE